VDNPPAGEGEGGGQPTCGRHTRSKVSSTPSLMPTNTFSFLASGTHTCVPVLLLLLHPAPASLLPAAAAAAAAEPGSKAFELSDSWADRSCPARPSAFEGLPPAAAASAAVLLLVERVPAVCAAVDMRGEGRLSSIERRSPWPDR
jgi:hypothetical protein